MADPSKRPLLLMFAASAAKLIIDRTFLLSTGSTGGTVIGEEFFKAIEINHQSTKDIATLRALGEHILFGESAKSMGFPPLIIPTRLQKASRSRHVMRRIVYCIGSA